METGGAGIFLHHGLTDVEGVIEEGRFDICLTNPPFGSTENDPDILKRYELGSGRKSQDRTVLAVERALRLVKPKGMVAIVVIDGLLDTIRARYVREYIKCQAYVRAVVSLAKETFQGYGSQASTSILFLERKLAPDDGQQESVFMALARNTGYAPNGNPVVGNELPDILLELKPFLKNRIRPQPMENIWVTDSLEDRLDARYYWQGSGSRSVDITALKEQTSKLIQETLQEFNRITSSLERLAGETAYIVIRLSDVLKEVAHKEEVEPNKLYQMLGVRLWGKGAYIREQKRGRDIKAKRLNRVAEGQLVYSRLFASKGCFALIESGTEGCYLSSEFPTFVLKGDTFANDLLRYIVYCLNSPHYLEIVDAKCSGSTKGSRNRLIQKIFLDLEIAVPKSDDRLKEIVLLLDRLASLQRRQEELMASLKQLQTGVSETIPLPTKE